MNSDCLFALFVGVVLGFGSGILFWLYKLEQFFDEYAESGKPYYLGGKQYGIRREA